MSIALKRIYEPADADDGYRVLVDRIWPRGVSRKDAALDDWCKAIAPSSALRKWFGHDPKRWDDFRAAYQDELAKCPPETLDALREKSNAGKLTLLFAARDERHNQAVALKDYLER